MNRNLLLCCFVFFVLGVTMVSAQVFQLDSNTIALWHFDEGSGDSILDETSNDNDGTISGATWTSDSVNGTALEFDGMDDKISIPKKSSMDLTEQVTIEAWIKIGSEQDGTIFSRNGPFFMAVRDRKVHGGIHTSGGGEGWAEVSGTTNLSLNEWYKVAMTYDGSFVKVYVDENLEGSVDKTGIMVVRSQQPWIGWGEPGHNQFFEGIIDEVRISDIARTFDGEDPPEDSLEEKINKLEERVDELESKVGLLESLINKIMEYFGFMNSSVKKKIVCSELEESGEDTLEKFGLSCKMKERNNIVSCSCKRH